MNEPTHILHWVPGYLVKGGADWGDGWWELQTIAAYESGEPQQDPEWTLEDEPRDVDAGDFTDWISRPLCSSSRYLVIAVGPAKARRAGLGAPLTVGGK